MNRIGRALSFPEPAYPDPTISGRPETAAGEAAAHPALVLRNFLRKTYDSRRGACIIKLITTVIYSFRNKLECLSLNNRLSQKGLPGTNTLVYYENRKLRPYKVL